MNNSILTEIEERQLGRSTFASKPEFQSQDLQKDNYSNILNKKHQILRELLNSIHRNRVGKLSSILKSKYDWKEFISKNDLENKMQYHRKDGFLEKNKLKEFI